MICQRLILLGIFDVCGWPRLQQNTACAGWLDRRPTEEKARFYVTLSIKRAFHGGSFIENMRVDHRRRDIFVSQEFLDRPDVVARFQ